jgi:hypothetical protein
MDLMRTRCKHATTLQSTSSTWRWEWLRENAEQYAEVWTVRSAVLWLVVGTHLSSRRGIHGCGCIDHLLFLFIFKLSIWLLFLFIF